ncbi:hypothetical protein VXN63_02060 [Marinilactibacillus sp. XAAS-LB27]|uniref:hypothetical protein n=1 Tax=Marinilactibacillus sp. XAAS-LB27 TaxID=3114538 RepID=UPI002E17E9C4|nr:hypothetical protein [Marinilactibacillus sp. XAAS-LB27]
MSKNKSKLMLGIGILLVLLGGYAFFLDPIIGGIGFLCGLWTIFLAIKALHGKSLFKDSTEEDEKR